MITKTKGGYMLRSHTSGKNLGTAKTLEEIRKREREVNYFKHLRSRK